MHELIKMILEYETKTTAMDQDVAIAFMGVTGSGKSSFIKAMTRRDDIVIGHALESCKNLTH